MLERKCISTHSFAQLKTTLQKLQSGKHNFTVYNVNHDVWRDPLKRFIPVRIRKKSVMRIPEAIDLIDRAKRTDDDTYRNRECSEANVEEINSNNKRPIAAPPKATKRARSRE